MKRVILLLVLGGGIGWGVKWYLEHQGIESTDDAQVDGEILGVPSRSAGTVVSVSFVENDLVRTGQLLATLDDAPARARVAQADAAVLVAEATAEAAATDVHLAEQNAVAGKAAAEASFTTASLGVTTSADQIKEAEAQVKSARTAAKHAAAELARAKSMFEGGLSTRAQLDQATTSVALANAAVGAALARVTTLQESVAQAKSRVTEANVKVTQTQDTATPIAIARARAAAAKAQVGAAKAARDLAALDLAHCQIFAPQGGVVSKKTVSVGQAIALGQPVAQLVTAKRWITANFKETQLSELEVGAPARIEVDTFDSVALTGVVESVSGATGSRFALLPPDNASGNFTKVVQRIPVRIRLDASSDVTRLRPGMSATVHVDTRGRARPGGVVETAPVIRAPGGVVSQ